MGGGVRDEWFVQEVTVGQKVGTHLRVVKRILERVSSLDVEMSISSERHRADARSLLDLMQLAAATGDRVRLEARGAQADEALAFVAALLAAPSWDAEIDDA